MEWPQELLDLFEDPILDGVRPKTVPLTPDDRRVKALIEINAWIDEHYGKEPRSNGELKEKMMARSLQALRRDANEGLKAYDRLNLFK